MIYAYRRGIVTADELFTHRQELRGQLDQLQARRDVLASTTMAEDRMAEMLYDLSDLADALPELPPTDLRERVYAPLIRRIELRKGETPRIVMW